jgi:hypothetical protein
MWGIEVMGQPTLRVVLLPMDASLVSRVLDSGRFFIAWLPSFLWRSCFLVGLCVTSFNRLMWGGARFIPSLAMGGEAPKAVYLASVEKVQVLRDDPTGHVC